jgi:hypothetical protein
VAVVVVWASLAGAAPDGIYTLELASALEEYLANVTVKYDATLLLEIEDDRVIRAGAYSATYGGINGYYHYKPEPGPYRVDASGLAVTGTGLSGLVKIDIPESFNATYPTGLHGSVELTLDVDLGAKSGSYEGSSTLEKPHEVAGAVEVRHEEKREGPAEAQVNAWLVNPLASPVLADRDYKYFMMLNFTVRDGAVGELSAYDGTVRGSDEFDDTVYTAKGPMLVSAKRAYIVHGGEAALSYPALNGRFNVTGPGDGNADMTYELSCEAFGDNLLGSFTLTHDGQTIKSGALIGFLAEPWQPLVGMPTLSPVATATADPSLVSRAHTEYETIWPGKGVAGVSEHPGFYGGTTPYWTDHFGTDSYLYTPADGISGGSRKAMFEGPYYQQVDDYLPRVLALLRYLRDTPYHGPFAWDFTLSHVSEGGNKTYDNGCFIGYGVAVSMALLERLGTVEEERLLAGEMARRAGDWLIHITGGPLELPGEYYKSRVWYTAWAGYAYIDLYTLTGEQKWLDAATRLAGSFASMQQESGTWTWADENSGELGSRTYSRESEEWYERWEEISAAEFLYFFGRLRAECGVEEFRETEHRALEWMKRMQGRTHLWVHNGEVGRFNVRQPEMFALYLLECAREEDGDDALAEELARMCEEKAVSWARGPGLAPFVAEPHLRAGSLGSPPNTASATRLARVFIALARRTGNDLWLAKAKALTHAVLSIQNPATGEIYQHRAEGPRGSSLEYKRNYHFYKTETALNLYTIGRELDRLGTVDMPKRSSRSGGVRKASTRLDIRVGARTVATARTAGRARSATVYGAGGRVIARVRRTELRDDRLRLAPLPSGVYVLVVEGTRGRSTHRFTVGGGMDAR